MSSVDPLILVYKGKTQTALECRCCLKHPTSSIQAGTGLRSKI